MSSLCCAHPRNKCPCAGELLHQRWWWRQGWMQHLLMDPTWVLQVCYVISTCYIEQASSHGHEDEEKVFFVTDSARALSDHSLFLLVHSKWKSRKLAGDNCGLVLFAQIFGWCRRASSTKGRKQVWPTQRVGLLLLGCPCFSNFRSVTHEAQARLLDKPMKRLDVASLIVIDCFNDNKPCHVWQIIQASVFQEAWPKQRYIIFPDKWDVSPLLIVFVLLFSSGRRVPRAEWEMSQQTVNFTTSFFW